MTSRRTQRPRVGKGQPVTGTLGQVKTPLQLVAALQATVLTRSNNNAAQHYHAIHAYQLDPINPRT